MWDSVAPVVLLGLFLGAIGFVLAVISAWMRRGSSRAARWWVRRVPLDEATDYANAEAIALAFTPMIAQTLIVAGLCMPVASFAVGGSGLGSTVLGAVLVVEILLWIVILLAAVYRWILPLWLYPSGLREVRRDERDRLRAAKEHRR
ncbi:hypothetical protein GCM10009626_19230 [Brachybacterium sacelli]